MANAMVPNNTPGSHLYNESEDEEYTEIFIIFTERDQKIICHFMNPDVMNTWFRFDQNAYGNDRDPSPLKATVQEVVIIHRLHKRR